ncbi:MAG: NAD(+)/NADH kinase [Bacteroidales bacterium]|nr:NAD(+)/NADH kinase [Bacteroidales bacterium]
MKIGLFGKKFSSDNQEYLQLLIKTLESNNIEISVLESYYLMILPYVTFSTKPKLLQNDKILQNEVDVLFSIGGDGTLLSSVGVIQDSNIPVLGVNIGHLGFLTSVNPNNGVENFVSEFIA